MRPLIGVTTSELRPSHLATLRHADPPRSEMALGTTYARAVAAAGGIPVVLPPVGLDGIDDLLERLDGICLSGGPDLDPVAYGAHTRHPELGPTAPELDDYELAAELVREASELAASVGQEVERQVGKLLGRILGVEDPTPTPPPPR